MSDDWEDVEVWKQVKGSSQVRRTVIGSEEWIDVRVDGEVLRIHTSAAAPKDNGAREPDEDENPVYFGKIEYESEYGDDYEDPRVKRERPDGSVTGWVTPTAPQTMKKVVATRLKKKGTPPGNDPEYVEGVGPDGTTNLEPGQYVSYAKMRPNGLKNTLQPETT